MTKDQMVEFAMSNYDKNKDGKLSKDELKGRMASVLKENDANKDGVLDKAEIEAMAEKMSQGRGGQGGGAGGRGGQGGGAGGRGGQGGGAGGRGGQGGGAPTRPDF